jgi:hypothetical protein
MKRKGKSEREIEGRERRLEQEIEPPKQVYLPAAQSRHN